MMTWVDLGLLLAILLLAILISMRSDRDED
jgi:hypothetical protein